MRKLYVAEYACGGEIPLPNRADPPSECPRCGQDLEECRRMGETPTKQ